MSERFFAVLTSFFIGFAVVLSGPQLYGQDESHDTHSEQVSEDHSHEAEDAHHSEDQHHGESEEFNATEYIMHHVADAHEWHILTTKDGHHVSVYLPVILYSKHSGFHLFSSKKLAHGHSHNGFHLGHGTIMIENRKGEEVEKNVDGTILELDEHGEIVAAGLPLDFSITKNVFMMLLSVIILLWVFLSLARSYKRMGISEPRGLQGFIEPVIVFIEEDVAIPNIGEHKYHRFMPYLLTVFFFILLNNLMGLIPFFPFGANVTGNIALTFVLATFTFLITQFSSNKGHWQHVFNTPGVPVWLAPIMIPVEIIGLFTKPFALMIRLFANITAGHIIVLGFFSLIFIFGEMAPAAGYGVSILSLAFTLFMSMLELLVALIQAYVFTLLSAIYFGMATEEHH